jgi:hypothetical protein
MHAEKFYRDMPLVVILCNDAVVGSCSSTSKQGVGGEWTINRETFARQRGDRGGNQPLLFVTE